jgi:hypothetical protein
MTVDVPPPIPVVWSRAWRGHLWHARPVEARASLAHERIAVTVTALCGYTPGDGCREVTKQDWSRPRCLWTATTIGDMRQPRGVPSSHRLACTSCALALDRAELDATARPEGTPA